MNGVKIEHTFDASDVDFLGKAKLSAVQRVFQSAAAADCKRLGMGTARLGEKNQGWIISRMRYKFERMPRLDDCLTFETWQTPPGNCEFIRVLRIADENGAVVAEGVSRWCIIDIPTAKPVLSADTDYDRSLPFDEDNPFKDGLKRLNDDGEWDFAFEEKIRLSKIDVNRHLNNTRYFDLVFDCFQTGEYEKVEIEGFQMDFRSQVKVGETIEVYRRQDGRTLWFKGEVCGRKVFAARMTVK